MSGGSGGGRVGGERAPILTFENVVKRYGQLEALRGVSCQVNRGEVVCLIGPSGSGKSTLLRCANALEVLDGGRITFDGADVHAAGRDARKVRQRMGMVFQNFELFPHLTVLRNVTIGPTTVLRLERDEAEARARALLAKVGLSDKAGQHPAALSGGQQQRVAIARAVIARPSLLLADEPTGNVDDSIGVRLMYLFEELNKMGTTVVIATHNERLVSKFQHRQLRVETGTVRLVTRPEAA
ncbi:MAG TPA: ATP-binding cassette domain-containing protein [Candidatus Acidoferrum sp.]|nr:ATP-binding cassette domain-containing protein [Candidatus Acidoferrum sp.]